jgi:hypothetical protein
VTPLPRKRKQGAPGRPFRRGDQAALVHGAYSPRMVDALAKEIIAGLLARPSCPRRLVEDPDDELLEAWGTTMAICRLLRSALTDQNITEAMTEQLSEDETTVRPAMGAQERTLRGKRRPSILDQLHRYQTQAMHQAKALGLDAASRRMTGEDKPAAVDYAKYWAQRAERLDAERAEAERLEAEGGTGS